MKHFLLLALVFSPAYADIYKCKSGGRTIYQEEPCPNATVVDSVNGRTPSREEQARVLQQMKNERSLLEQLDKTAKTEQSTVTLTQKSLPGPAAPIKPTSRF